MCVNKIGVKVFVQERSQVEPAELCQEGCTSGSGGACSGGQPEEQPSEKRISCERSKRIRVPGHDGRIQASQRTNTDSRIAARSHQVQHKKSASRSCTNCRSRGARWTGSKAPIPDVVKKHGTAAQLQHGGR